MAESPCFCGQELNNLLVFEANAQFTTHVKAIPYGFTAGHIMGEGTRMTKSERMTNSEAKRRVPSFRY